MEIDHASIAPWLSVSRGAEALAYYQAAFGAQQQHYFANESGQIVAQLSVGGATFWIADDDEFSPETLGGGTARMILTVDDPDAVFRRAVDAGGTIVADMYEGHGWRLGRIRDPFGHHWEIGRPIPTPQ
jgi:PhnB protein